ncbi:hypothetical protein M5E87_15765 [Flavonifractor plautii]|nr:hypothetical protein M5E87_15765 [Flavonifractor plautii]
MKLLRQLGLSLEEIRQAQRESALWRPCWGAGGGPGAAAGRAGLGGTGVPRHAGGRGGVCHPRRPQVPQYWTARRISPAFSICGPTRPPPSPTPGGAISRAAWTTAFAAFYGWWCACSCSAGFLRTTGESGC